jgi:hypothetical protein
MPVGFLVKRKDVARGAAEIENDWLVTLDRPCEEAVRV